MKHLMALALCGLLIAGCSSTKKADETTSGTSSGTSSGKSGNSLAGTYKVAVVMAPSADGKEDPAKKMAAEMAKMMTDTMSLEMKDDGTFTLTALMMPVEGKWKRNGDSIDFMPEKAMGMSAADIEAKAKAEGKTDIKADEMLKPFTMTFSADGKLTRKGDKPDDPSMEFTKEAPRTVGESKVEGKEADMVGKFTGIIEPQAGKTLSKDDESQLEFMKSMKIELELFQDKKFALKLGAKLEGDWKLEGETLTLTPKTVAGAPVDGKTNKADPIVCTIRPDGSMTSPAPDGAPVQLVFKR